MRRLFIIVVLLAIGFSAGHAQTTETPVAFDTGDRIVSINMPLVERLGLKGVAAWPVTGDFVEARLFQVSNGTFVIAVSRPGGLTSRYNLTADEAAALRAAVTAGSEAAGRAVVDNAADMVSEQARGPFVRNQMILATIMYGPALSSLADDPAVGTGLYLMSVGGTFFTLNGIPRDRLITVAQNNMSTDGALRGWATTALAANALGVDLSEHGAAWTALVGGVGGSLVGFQRARHLTNSEATAAMTMSTLAAGTAYGLGVTSGLVNDDGTSDASERTASTLLLAGGAIGYLTGQTYPRRASYTVTSGDVSMVRLGALLGTAAALTPIVGMEDPDAKLIAGVATAGWVLGAVAGDRIGAKPFNYDDNDARMVQLGALGGALMGLALPIMTRSTSATFNMAMGTGGAILGAAAASAQMAPPRQGGAVGNTRGNNNSGGKLEFNPEGLAMTLAGKQGNHSLLRIRF